MLVELEIILRSDGSKYIYSTNLPLFHVIVPKNCEAQNVYEPILKEYMKRNYNTEDYSIKIIGNHK